jgi:beta-galactosidase
MLTAGLDFTRSAGHSFHKGFWIGELQAGQGATGMQIAGPVTGEDEEYWMWQAVSHGAQEIAVYAWYPMSSGFESNGYGLINLDRTLTPRAKVAGQVANAIARHGEEILRSTPAPAQVAVLYNRLSYMVGGSQPSLSKLGNAERDSLLGLYSAFLDRNIPVDFVDTQDVAHDRMGQYKILFLPFPVMLSQDVAAGVKRYVEAGGTAVAEARLAWNDERGFASDVIPGAGLSQVFGARETMIKPSDKVRMQPVASSEFPRLAPHTEIKGQAFEEDLEPLHGARVLARFPSGDAAIVENSNDKGKAVLLGSFLALAYYRDHDPAIRELFLSLARAAGVAQDVEVSGTGTSELEVRQLTGNGYQMIFAFNHGSQPAAANLRIRLPWTAREARELQTDQPVNFENNPGTATFHKNLKAGEVWVFEVRGS